MPRKTKKEQLAERQDAAAPYLFDEKSLPVRADVLQAVKEQRYAHTGARLLDNEALALRLVEGLMAGHGVKRIAQNLQVSPHTVRAAKRELVAQGKLAPFKERIVRVFEEIIEVGSEKYLEGLEDGQVDPGQIPVGVGIFSDKRALALGEPTAISVAGVASLDQGNLSVEKLNDWVNSLPTDAESSGLPQIHQKSEGSAGADVTLDAGQTGRTEGKDGGLAAG